MLSNARPAGPWRVAVDGLPADAATLLDQVDVEEAARHGVQLAVLRALVREWEATHGPLTERERQAARHELGLITNGAFT